MEYELIQSVVKTCTTCDAINTEQCNSGCKLYKLHKEVFDGNADTIQNFEAWESTHIREEQG